MQEFEEKENLTFHYNREERLAHAPSIVKKSYAGELPKPPKGLFKALVHTKGSRFILLVLAFTLVLTIGIHILGPQENETSIDGITFTMSAFSFNETVYISIKTEAKTDINTTEDIAVSFSFRDADEQEIQTQEFSYPFSKIEDFIRTTIRDYDILSVHCTVTVGQQSETITCTVEQK